jgi:superfamily II DNA helicase RecQ
MDVNFEEPIQYSLQQLGYESIRPQQRDIVAQMLSGVDCLLVASTGFGKSYCFQAIPLATEYIKKERNEDPRSVVLVISPLISLMKMQARKLQEKGISAAYLQVRYNVV